MFDIGEAVHHMRNGYKVARMGWNGNGMWLALSPGKKECLAANFWAAANREYAETQFGSATVRPYVTMKAADGTIVPWTCSQSDLLANDWVIVGEKHE